MFYSESGYKINLFARAVDEMKSIIFCFLTPCSCENLRRFGVTYYKKSLLASGFLLGLLLDLENGGDISFRNFEPFPNYRAL
jgi:hypothetical protein